MKIRSPEIAVIRETLSRLLVNRPLEIFLYGSRIDGSSRSGSDLDVIVRAPTEIPFYQMAVIKDFFENSRLPFKVDLHDVFYLPEGFLKLIEKTAIRIRLE